MQPAPVMEPTERFEIQLSHVCNNRCVFCVSGQMTELRMAKPTPLPEVKAKFDEAARRGITKVTIMGGEPTIHPTFFPTVEYALELATQAAITAVDPGDEELPPFETFLFDFDADIYGRHLEIALVGHIRGQEVYKGLDELIAAIARDGRKARQALGQCGAIGELDRTLGFFS